MLKFALPVRYAIALSGLLISYFLIISLFGWHTNPLFSLFNGVITAFGVYEAIKGYKLRNNDKFTYADGFTTGIVTGFLATLLFTIFFGIYAGNINPTFTENFMGPWGSSTSLGIILFTVAICGFATTAVLTLSFMQLFKPSWNLAKSKETTPFIGKEIVE
ncbi:hypothetical protein GCM10011344_40640 [Dokdonia pacifica]|uniref:DUF4199 domain-containing protein n=1 Tax=Dokdonia pacifica TaxID=1627892 RepID=A0A239A909_9FLAO|nr:DUF4199 domain-containing protein [Dokdonia pacifica]GGG35647.1 hypothetical protein GCM10011344_40640 [Dokdonia pacifica]SNR92136.1 Protein of unknown function [Dokdonia pacifica]